MFELVLGIMVGGAGMLLIEQYRSGVLSPRTHGSEDVRRYAGHAFTAHCGACDQCAACGRLRGTLSHTA